MTGKHGKGGRGRKGRSAEQREGSAAMIQVMKAWEELSDLERRTWNTASKARRRKAVNYFKSVNLRRARRGEELTRMPPPYGRWEERPGLKRLDIGNRGGRISLKLEVCRAPGLRTTVWGSRPCNLGVQKPE